jgi:uncharacterized protein YndB with AHSA1/START domain
MKNENTKTGSQARVTHRFQTSAENVFDAWLNPEKIRIWFAPGLGEMVRINVDAKVGGSFSFIQRRDGKDIDHVGEYIELIRPRRLAFTWRVPPSKDSSHVSIDIIPLQNGSEATLVHELHPDWADFASRCEDSWRKMLNAMDTTFKK